MLGRVADVQTEGADERAAILEEDGPATEVSAPRVLGREAQRKDSMVSSIGRWVSQRSLTERNTIPLCATLASDWTLVNLGVVV